MAKRIESVIYAVPVLLVLVTALLDLGLAVGLAIAFVVGAILFHWAQRRGLDELASTIINNSKRPPAER